MPANDDRTTSLPCSQALIALALFAATALFASTAVAETPDAAPALRFDPAQLVPARWRYQIVEDGKATGAVVVDFHRGEAGFSIHDLSTLPPGVSEDVLLLLDGETYASRSLLISGDFNGVHAHTRVAVADRRVRGHLSQHRAADGRFREQAIDLAWPEGGHFRGSVIWLAHALPLAEGATFHASWYSSLAGRFEDVTLRVTGVESVTVPAGTFEAFRVVQEGGTPGNVLFVTTAAPRRTVRIEVVGRPMTIDLVGVGPAEAGSGDG